MACAGLVAMIAAPAATARTLPNLIDADSVGAELARPDRARRPVSGPPADSNTTAAATPAERDRPKRGWTERARAEQAPPLRQSFAAKTVDATPLDRFVRGITLAWLLGVFVLLAACSAAGGACGACSASRWRRRRRAGSSHAGVLPSVSTSSRHTSSNRRSSTCQPSSDGCDL